MHEVVVGVIAGVVAALIWAGMAWGKHWFDNRANFGRLAGRYRIKPKLEQQSDLGTGSVVGIAVSQNLLSAQFEGMPEGDSVTGEIAMSEFFPRSGEGHYQHLKNGQQLWGFWKLHVRDANTLLVHHTYARRDTSLVTQAFLWERI